jgi:nucleotide-binding universal stress UspA family protein
MLVATDLSAPADEAVRQAHEWATALGAELVVCHVVPARYLANPLFPQRNENDSLEAVEFERRAAELVTARVSELTGRSPEDFRLSMDIGRPEAGILRAATSLRVELIVIGNRGETGLDRVLLGSVSERVVQHAHCSVLVARPMSERGRVLVATDLSDPSLPAVGIGALEAKRRRAKLVVMHNLDLWPPPLGAEVMGLAAGEIVPSPAVVEEERLRAVRHLKELLAGHGVEGESTVTTGLPDASIVRLADEIHPELLVIGTHGRTGFSRLALGSVAERVVQMASCSVLVVRLES